METTLIAIKHFSISQLNKYEECPRKHYYQYVLGYESPSSDAQDYGKKCHSYLEQYLKGEINVFPTDWHGKTCTAALPYLPPQNSGLVEEYFKLELENLVAPIIGYMDYCSYGSDVSKAVLLDHKIVSSDQYLLTPEKLAKTNQIITYSKYILDQCNADSVEASYLYVKRGGSWAKKVTVELGRNQVNESFQNVADGFEMLQKNYTTTTEENVPQILSACEKWGGCPFKDRCWGNQKGDNMNLLDRLKSVKVDTSVEDQKTASENTQSVFKMISSAKTTLADKKNEDGILDDLNLDDINLDQQNESLVEEEVSVESDEEEEVNYFQLAADSEPILHVLTTANAPIKVDLKSFDESDMEAIVLRATQQLSNLTNVSKDESKESQEALLESIRLDVIVGAYEEDVIDGENIVHQTSASQQDVDVVSSDDDLSNQKTNGWDFYDLDEDKASRWLDADIAYVSELANRTRNSLKKHGFLSLREVLSQYPNPNELLDANIKGFGQGCVDDLKLFLDSKQYLKDETKVTLNKGQGLQEKLSLVDTKQEQVITKTNDSLVSTVNQKEAELVDNTVSSQTSTQVVSQVSSQAPTQVVNQVSSQASTQVVNQVSSQAPAQEVIQPTPNDKPTQKNESSVSTNKILLMGVQPMKGLGFIYFEDWIADLENEIAETNNVPHICMINFAKGYDILTAMIRQGILSNKLDWSTPIYVSTQAQITYAKAVSVLYQNASLVLKNV
jgi:hypothetical protein